VAPNEKVGADVGGADIPAAACGASGFLSKRLDAGAEVVFVLGVEKKLDCFVAEVVAGGLNMFGVPKIEPVGFDVEVAPNVTGEEDVVGPLPAAGAGAGAVFAEVLPKIFPEVFPKGFDVLAVVPTLPLPPKGLKPVVGCWVLMIAGGCC